MPLLSQHHPPGRALVTEPSPTGESEAETMLRCGGLGLDPLTTSQSIEATTAPTRKVFGTME